MSNALKMIGDRGVSNEVGADLRWPKSRDTNQESLAIEKQAIRGLKLRFKTRNLTIRNSPIRQNCEKRAAIIESAIENRY